MSGQKQIAGVIKQINRFNLLEFSPGGLMLTEKQIDNKIKTLTRKFEEMFETIMSQ